LLAILLFTLQESLVLSPLKWLQLRRIRRHERAFHRSLDAARTPEQLAQVAAGHPQSPGARVLARLVKADSTATASYEDLLGCAHRALAEERELCERFMPTLASIASIAPLLGLFGTVWGIIETFLKIAQTQSSQLPVIAPAMSGALLTTAFGLLAAMPASLSHHHVDASIGRLLEGIEAIAESWSGRIAARNAEAGRSARKAGSEVLTPRAPHAAGNSPQRS